MCVTARGVAAGNLRGMGKERSNGCGRSKCCVGCSCEKNRKFIVCRRKIKKHAKQESYTHLHCKGSAAGELTGADGGKEERWPWEKQHLLGVS